MISSNARDRQVQLLIESDYDLKCFMACVPSLYVEWVLQ